MLPVKQSHPLLRLFVVAVVALGASHVHADQGGVPFWFSGQYASLSATPATPGWGLTLMGYSYSGSASRSNSFPVDESVSAGLTSDVSLMLLQPSYAPETTWLDAQASIGLGFGYGRNSTTASLSTTAAGTQRNRSDVVTGFTDLYPIVSLAWNRGVDNWMTYVTGDIPVGAYDSQRLLNIGIGHAGFATLVIPLGK